MKRARYLLLAALFAGCGARSQSVTPSDAGKPSLAPSEHGRSSCTSTTLRSLAPSVGTVVGRTDRTTDVEIEDVPHALELACGDRTPTQCYEEAKTLAPLVGAQERSVVKYRTVISGHAVALDVGGATVPKVYASEADLVDEIRRLESEHKRVNVGSVGRAVAHDWSIVDVQVRGPMRARPVATTDLELTLPSTSLRTLAESVHVLMDELRNADVVVVNEAAIFEALGGRLLDFAGATTANRSAAAVIGTLSSNYPAIDDTHVERPLSIVLSTRCRADFEE